MKETVFEHVPCTRCEGSGHHSYNPRSGTICFKCKGTGYQHTKRGLIAAKAFLASLYKPLSEVKVGDAVLLTVDFDLSSGAEVKRWCEVTEVNAEGIVTKETTFVAPPICEVRVRWTNEEKAAKQKAALDYQATLTAKGEVRKR